MGHNQDIEVVIFDMGGVLVELGPLDRALGVDGRSSEEFWARWLASPAVRALEAGRCTVERFAADLAVELGLTLSPEEIIDHFMAVPLGLFPGARELVAAIPDRIHTALLSNTNAAHWGGQPDADLIATLCDRQYLSFELGLTKPDRPIFDHVVADLGVPAAAVLFLDDSPANVTGARAAGLVSERVRGPGEAASALVDHGVLTAPPPAS
ncbi:MAG: HAD family phosphatase [Actinomycetota bacterium]